MSDREELAELCWRAIGGVEWPPRYFPAVRDMHATADAILASDWLAKHDAEVRTAADASWSEQVEKYARLVDSYQESIDRVQASVVERLARARAEERRSALAEIAHLKAVAEVVVLDAGEEATGPEPDPNLAELAHILTVFVEER